MFFKRIDKKTINCVITAQDLSDNGIQLNDLFERKEEAIEMLKSAIVASAEAENFPLDGDYTQMRISLLPDHSLSLTLTEGGNVMQSLAEAAQQLKAAVAAQLGQTEGSEEHPKDQEPVERVKQYAYAFSSMECVIDGCKGIADADGFDAGLYSNEDSTEYYLILTNLSDSPDADFEKMVLSLSEFGTLINEGAQRLSYIREHETCIVKTNAAKILAKLG